MSEMIELRNDRSEKIHYDCHDYPIYIRKGFLSSYPNYIAPKHWHDDIELIAVLSGEMKYKVNGEVIRLQCGEGIFVNAGQIHFGYSDTCKECEFLCILLHPMLLCTTVAYEQDFVLPIICNSNVPFVFFQMDVSWQEKILKQIYFMYEACKNRKTMPLLVQSGFVAIWALLYENIPENDSPAYQSSDLTITKNMVGFIQKNYASKISLASIASAGAIGQSKCCKLFSKYFKQTPISYLNQYRLNKSIHLLHATDMTITEIAFSVGFNSASYYTETFRKWMGKSPTEFKNNRSIY